MSPHRTFTVEMGKKRPKRSRDRADQQKKATNKSISWFNKYLSRFDVTNSHCVSLLIHWYFAISFFLKQNAPLSPTITETGNKKNEYFCVYLILFFCFLLLPFVYRWRSPTVSLLVETICFFFFVRFSTAFDGGSEISTRKTLDRKINSYFR